MDNRPKTRLKASISTDITSHILVLYRPISEEARRVEEFVQDFHHLYPDISLVTVDIDSQEGTRLGELYDVLEYPAILAIAGDGSLLNAWLGGNLPLVDDVAGYMRG